MMNKMLLNIDSFMLYSSSKFKDSMRNSFNFNKLRGKCFWQSLKTAKKIRKWKFFIKIRERLNFQVYNFLQQKIACNENFCVTRSNWNFYNKKNEREKNHDKRKFFHFQVLRRRFHSLCCQPCLLTNFW